MDQTWWRSTQELDDDQRSLIEIPIADGNHLVTGPPGCGKTNILLLRASYLRSAGLGNCVILVFTRTLREFIAAGSNRPTMLPPDRIHTHAAWTLNLLHQLGQPFAPSQPDLPHDDARRERHLAIESAVQKAGLDDSYYDSILLDEVQDYWACEVELLSKLTRRLFTVGDNRQRIYDRNEGLQAALDIGCEEHRLSYHYRMGSRIFRAADQILSRQDDGRLESYCQYDDREQPSRVSIHPSVSFQEQLELLEKNLVSQLRAYPDELLGVFALRNRTVNQIAEFLDQTEQPELVDNVLVQSIDEEDRAFDSERRVIVSTLHSAKGTEFRSVHFIDADDFPHFTREKAFTAITRAKTTLDVYHSHPMEGALESALAQPTTPNLNGILG